MNEKQFISLFKEFRSSLKVEQLVKLFFLLKAWKKLSPKIEDKELTFEYFSYSKIDVIDFEYIIGKLSNKIKLFEFFLNQNIKLDENSNKELKIILEMINTEYSIPSVFDIFYFLLDSLNLLVANQIANLSVELLDCQCNEIYSPFSNSYNIGYYTNKKILAESFADEYIIELMKIIDDINIDFNFVDPLVDPTYIDNSTIPYSLKKFKCVISFPPIGLSDDNEFRHLDRFNRFKFHKSKSNKEVAHFEHILAQTCNKAVVLTHVGFTYRGNQDEEFRKYLIENNLLEAVIQLAPNLHNATTIETTFIVINMSKKDNKIFFLNLKHDDFLQKEGRKLILNNFDRIISIYKNKQEVKDISRLVMLNEIAQNNYTFAIDRYVIAENAKDIQKKLEKFELVELEDIAIIRRSQLFKNEEEGLEVFEISPSDFNKAGFTLECGKIKQIGSQEKRLDTYELQPYDILLSTKGTIGKVAIIGDITKPMIASQAIQVIRIKDKEKQEKAVSLYMFLKSDLGQTILSSLVVGVAMPQISTVEIKKLKVPSLNKNEEEKLFLNFNSELEMYNKITNLEENIKQLHSEFFKVKNEI